MEFLATSSKNLTDNVGDFVVDSQMISSTGYDEELNILKHNMQKLKNNIQCLQTYSPNSKGGCSTTDENVLRTTTNRKGCISSFGRTSSEFTSPIKLSTSACKITNSKFLTKFQEELDEENDDSMK